MIVRMVGDQLIETDDILSVSVVRDTLESYIERHRDVGIDYNYRTVDEVYNYLNDTATIVLIEDTYLFIYTAGYNYFSYDRILQEEIFCKYGEKHIPFSTVVDAIDRIATIENCNMIQLGTLADSSGLLPRLYRIHGYREVAKTYLREV